MLSDDVRVCPVCGAAIEVKATGRPPRFCSKACRQAANRAKQRAQAAIVQAAGLRRRSRADARALRQAAFALDAHLDQAGVGAVEGAGKGAGPDGWQQTPPSGWEEEAQRLAATLTRLGEALYRDARAHARTVGEHGRALAGAGIRRAKASSAPSDETPGRPSEDVDQHAAVDGQDEDGGAVRDRFFDAVEDLIAATHPTSAAGSRLPGPLADGLTGPAGELAVVFAGASGAGPLDRLADAAAAVIEAAQRYRGEWSPQLTAAHTAMTAALTTFRPGGRCEASADETPPGAPAALFLPPVHGG